MEKGILKKNLRQPERGLNSGCLHHSLYEIAPSQQSLKCPSRIKRPHSRIGAAFPAKCTKGCGEKFRMNGLGGKEGRELCALTEIGKRKKEREGEPPPLPPLLLALWPFQFRLARHDRCLAEEGGPKRRPRGFLAAFPTSPH